MFGSFSNLEEIFHISLLEPVKTSTIPKWHQEPPPPIIIEEEEEWEVCQILYSKIKRGNLCYLVEWKGFSHDPERSTWEPTKNLNNFPKRIQDFHSLYPENPGFNSPIDWFCYGSWWGEELPKLSPTPGMHL
ncbi:hypothetical protein O181_056952 [Austropuccinia psidii MF-1]|uniref:Chromo domain-containing protein n=1 Tax=Austropuccinia psidii MF-1 TaxID=1389203 RepID=A0A9Q3EBS6_9BASI|nr:hypothetical protein [Austropuccinia psidii MF-1]